MILLKTISVFLHKKAVYEADAVQGETGRGIALRLQDENGAWDPPARTQALVRFKKADGTGGVYDTMPDGTAAWEIEGNVVTLALVSQVLSAPGTVQLQVVLVADGMELSTFTIHIHVEADISQGVLESEDYVNLTTQIENSVVRHLRQAEQTWQALFDEITITMFSKGALDFGTGAEVVSTTDIRSDMIVMGSRAISVVFPDGVWVQCYYYDQNEKYIRCSQMFSEPFTTQCDAANVRLVACYEDEREITDLYGLSDSIAVSFPSDRTDNYRGEVTELGFTTFRECVEDGCYSFRNPALISDAPVISSGGMLTVRTRGSQGVMQTILTNQGECWFRVAQGPFRRIPNLSAADVGALPAELKCRVVSVSPSKTVSGRIAWNENVTGGNEHPEAEYSIFDISGRDVIYITGHQWGSAYYQYSYVIYDENGAAISKAFAVADNNGFVDMELELPQGSATIRINGKVPLYAPAVKYRENVQVADVIEEVVREQKRPKLITLGDSITSLGLSNQGWVKYFLEATNCELIANVAVVGARLKDRVGTVYDGNPVFNGADGNTNNVLGNQVQKIINNGYDAPDLIMIAIGTNDGINITAEAMEQAYYHADGSLLDLTKVDRTTDAGAYRYCLETLHNLYPNAVICWCTPIHGCHKLRSPKMVMDWAESLRIATEFSGQILIDTIHCGMNGVKESTTASGEYTMDGLNPNMKGAKKIGYYNASKVLPLIRGELVKG